jgi:S-adenosylmethionine:tRNA ribosyltransferase-isomerase
MNDTLQLLEQKNISRSFITLHVGSGTFQPVRVDDLTQHVMHSEYFQVSEACVEMVRNTKANGGRSSGDRHYRCQGFGVGICSRVSCSAGCGDTALVHYSGVSF